MFKFGIIGAGHIAHKFCDAMRRVDGAAAAAVSSKSVEKAAEFAADENIPEYYGDYETMLDQGGLDAVYIATTHNFHFENAMMCLNKGFPVLIEKAMALNKKEAEAIFSLSASKGLFVMEAMWSRFLPYINRAREWIAEGAIGQPITASCSFCFKANPDPESRYSNPRLAGGALYDLGVYAIELVTYMLNLPVRDVRAMFTRGKTGVDMTDNILLKFDGCTAHLLTSLEVNVPGGTAIYGGAGRIEIPNVISGNECVLYREGQPPERFVQEYENGFVYEIEETMRCIRAGLTESPVVPHADTLKCAEIFDFVLSGK